MKEETNRTNKDELIEETESTSSHDVSSKTNEETIRGTSEASKSADSNATSTPKDEKSSQKGKKVGVTEDSTTAKSSKERKKQEKEILKQHKQKKKEQKKQEGQTPKTTQIKNKILYKGVITKNNVRMFPARLRYLFTGKVTTPLTEKDLVLKKPDPLSIVFTIITSIVLIACCWFTFYCIEALNDNNDVEPMYDSNFNYMVNIPTYWTKSESLDTNAISKKVFEKTKGLAFDFDTFELDKEILSWSGYVEPESKKSPVMKKIMTVAFDGQSNLNLDDSVKLMDKMRKNLQGIKMKNVDVKYVEDKEIIKGITGVVIKATGELKGVQLHFYQYYLPVGQNVAIFTYGNATKKDGFEDLETVVKSFQYTQSAGGITYDSFEEGEDYQSDDKAKDTKSNTNSTETKSNSTEGK